ncbi:MAG: phage tail protein [Balneolaceae bacterium]|nr:phage tail protein [Balneolaceae bacterium]
MKSRKTFLKGIASVLTLGWFFSGNEEAKANELNSNSMMRSAEPFLGQMMLFAGNFAPRGWALCDGQLLPISQNTALFSILGTTYGGDGMSTFALPDLRGRVPLHSGQGPGLTNRSLGQAFGSETNTITVNQMPPHSHTLRAATVPGSSNTPEGNVPAVNRDGILHYGSTADTNMGSGGMTSTGGGQPMDNIQPSLAINYCIALQGVFPSRD